MQTTSRRLKSVYNAAETVFFDEKSRFIIMSDCHRGQGNTGDSFLPNRILYKAALEHYYNNGYTYIELGDGDELWENRKIQPIIAAHSDIFRIMSRFYNENRLYMLYGNHDIIKRRKRIAKSEYESFFCDSEECKLFPNIVMLEGLVLEERRSKQRIFLVHGHQGSFLNDTIWPIARFLVRYFWKPLELIGFTAPTGAAITHSDRDATERRLSAYANENRIMLIAGHTHRPAFPSVGRGLYFNDGSCVHPKSITGIEISGLKISLVKWSVTVREDMSLFVKKEVLNGPETITDFFECG